LKKRVFFKIINNVKIVFYIGGSKLVATVEIVLISLQVHWKVTWYSSSYRW